MPEQNRENGHARVSRSTQNPGDPANGSRASGAPVLDFDQNDLSVLRTTPPVAGDENIRGQRWFLRDDVSLSLTLVEDPDYLGSRPLEHTDDSAFRIASMRPSIDTDHDPVSVLRGRQLPRAHVDIFEPDIVGNDESVPRTRDLESSALDFELSGQPVSALTLPEQLRVSLHLAEQSAKPAIFLGVDAQSSRQFAGRERTLRVISQIGKYLLATNGRL
jgi:hypothetical protein